MKFQNISIPGSKVMLYTRKRVNERTNGQARSNMTPNFFQSWGHKYGGWLGGVSCHRGVHLTLAYSWARLAILVAGKGRGGMFLLFCFFTFIPVPLSSLFLSYISSTISSISFLPFSGRQHKMTHKG